jgi:hypothetical protein
VRGGQLGRNDRRFYDWRFYDWRFNDRRFYDWRFNDRRFYDWRFWRTTPSPLTTSVDGAATGQSAVDRGKIAR